MAKVYMVRHQRAGIVTSHVFASPPTEEQVAPIVAECERLHGREGWVKIHEADLLLLTEVPVFPERAPASGQENGAAVPVVGIEGTGTVTPAA